MTTLRPFLLLLIMFVTLNSRCRNSSGTAIEIKTDSIVCDSFPFWQMFNFADFDSSRKIELKGIDKIAVYTFELQFIDSLVLSRLPHPPNDRILCATGIRRSDNQTCVMLDTDHDNDLAEENVYSLKDAPYIFLKNVEYLDGSAEKMGGFYVRPGLSDMHFEVEGGSGIKRPKTNAIPDFGFYCMPRYRIGTFRCESGDYKVGIFNYLQDEYNDTTAYLSYVPINNRFPDPRFGAAFYKRGDIFYLGESSYKFSKIARDGSTITLEQMPYDKKKPGVDSGYTALNIEGNDLLSGSAFNLADSKKYILLDFWGTWCNPCLATIPKLKLLNQDRKKHDLDIVSIACNDNIDKVKHQLRKDAITWTNLYDDGRISFDNAQSKGIAGRFRVSAFPTFILIDANGKIIKRVSGENCLDEIINYLEKNNK